MEVTEDCTEYYTLEIVLAGIISSLLSRIFRLSDDLNSTLEQQYFLRLVFILLNKC
jgi:hypothetical protein